MTRPSRPPIKVAVLDLYDGEKNLGLSAINAVIRRFSGKFGNFPFECDLFDVRGKNEIPSLEYDIFVSSGGPGSPFDGVGKAWERDYFNWIDSVWQHNQKSSISGDSKKHVLFICHSFQMMVRHFELAEVIERQSPSFGVFPIHPVGDGFHDKLFAGLSDPFYAADFRHWQVVSKRAKHMKSIGAKVIAREKIRPEVPLERAIMGIRVSPELVGVQFHPEADPAGMLLHFENPDRLRKIVEDHGMRKYQRIISRLDHPHFLARTYAAVIPNFLHESITALRTANELELI